MLHDEFDVEKVCMYRYKEAVSAHNANLFINRGIVTKRKRSVGRKEFLF